jgi:hypothetical protein
MVGDLIMLYEPCVICERNYVSEFKGAYCDDCWHDEQDKINELEKLQHAATTDNKTEIE